METVPRMVSQWQEILLAWPFMFYVAAVFCLCWAAVSQGASLSFVLLLAFLFLYEVESRQRKKVAGKIRYEERMKAEKNKLGDEETVAWLNHSLEKIWPLCLERFTSQGFLMRVAPWFLDKYKPWTAKKTVLHHLHLGSRPPHFTSISVNEKPAEGYTMVLDVKMDFVAAQDMSAVLAVQLRKRLGFGLWTTFHLSNLQLEGKVRLGIKVTSEFPFVERICLCFQDAPCFQLTVRPVFNYGVDVADIPGVATWLDKMFADAMENSLVEPNMMVIDVQKLLESFMPFKDLATAGAPYQPDWFYKEEKPPLAVVHVEILEAKNLKPSDPNGLADPFVKAAMGLSRFKTKIKHKTLAPVWNEEFRLPVSSWDLPNLLVLRVRDKDRFHDDELGYSVLPIANFRGGERHLKWLTLRGVKMGKLLVAITVDEKVPSAGSDEAANENMIGEIEGSQQLQKDDLTASKGSQAYLADCLRKGIDLADPGPELIEKSGSDEYEDINIGSGRGGMLSIFRSGLKKQKQKKNSGKATNAEAVAKRQYLAGDGLVDRSIRTFGGVNLNLDDSESGSDFDCAKSEQTEGRKRFWNRRLRKGQHVQHGMQQQSDTHRGGPSTSSEMPEEIRTVGKMGTEVIVKLEPSEEDLGTTGIHRQDPVEGEGYSGSVSKTGHEKQHGYGKGPMKKIGKGFLHQAGKTAYHLSHAKTQIHHAMQRRKGEGRDSGSANQSPRAPLSEEGRKDFDSCVTVDAGSADSGDLQQQVDTVRADRSLPVSPQTALCASAEENDAEKSSLALAPEHGENRTDYLAGRMTDFESQLPPEHGENRIDLAGRMTEVESNPALDDNAEIIIHPKDLTPGPQLMDLGAK